MIRIWCSGKKSNRRAPAARFAALCLTLLAVSETGAQRLADVAPGKRLRLRSHDGSVVQGRLVAVERDSIALTRLKKDSVRIALASLDAYSIGCGNPSRGTLIGAAIGLAVGTIAYNASREAKDALDPSGKVFGVGNLV